MNDSSVYTERLHIEEGFHFTSAKIHSPLFASAIKMGTEFYLAKNWYLDLFMGIGVRYINTRYDAQNVRPVSIPPPREFGYFKDAYECDCAVTRLHATIGFRVMKQL